MRWPSLACAIVVALPAAASTASRPASAREAASCPPADGNPAKQARLLFEEAVQYEASEPDRALALYQCAASLADRAVIELRIGVVAERLQREDVAIAAFERYLALAGSAAPDVDTMHKHVADLKASRAKRESQARSAESPAPAAAAATSEPARSSTPPYLGWSLVAGGAVLAAIGVGFSVDAKSKSDEVQALPPGTPWTSDQARGTYDGARRSQTVGLVCFAIAPALLVTGVVLLLKSRGGSPSRSVGSAIHPLKLEF